jgi:hypothetical protein
MPPPIRSTKFFLDRIRSKHVFAKTALFGIKNERDSHRLFSGLMEPHPGPFHFA